MSASLAGWSNSCVKHNVAARIEHGDMDATVSLASGISGAETTFLFPCPADLYGQSGTR